MERITHSNSIEQGSLTQARLLFYHSHPSEGKGEVLRVNLTRKREDRTITVWQKFEKQLF